MVWTTIFRDKELCVDICLHFLKFDYTNIKCVYTINKFLKCRRQFDFSICYLFGLYEMDWVYRN